MIWDKASPVKISAPHNRCTALKYANKSLRFGTQPWWFFIAHHLSLQLYLHSGNVPVSEKSRFNPKWKVVLFYSLYRNQITGERSPDGDFI